MTNTTHRVVMALLVGLLALPFALVINRSDAARADTPTKASQSLQDYLVTAMATWVPPGAQPEGEEAARARYAEIASDVASVVSDPSEAPLFDRDEDRHKTGLLVLSIASLESSYFARVDEGHCLPRECDRGLASTMWQVHFERGIALDGGGWKYDPAGFHPKDALGDRKLAVRIVLHLLRGPHDGLWDGGKRRRRAEEFAVAHPFRAP